MHLRVYVNNVALPDLYDLYDVSNTEGLIGKIRDQLTFLKTQKIVQNVELKSVNAKTKSWFSVQDTDLMNLNGAIPDIVEENGVKIVNAYVETMTGGRRKRKTRKTKKNKRV